MDPNETLRLLRELAQEPDESAALHMGWLFEALDEWLSNGGFLPSDWQRKHASCATAAQVAAETDPYVNLRGE